MKAAAIAKTIRAGSLRIDIREYADGRFGFDFHPPGGERQRVRLLGLHSAEERASELIGVARAGKVERLAIDEDEYAEFLRWKAERGTGALVPALVGKFKALQLAKGLSPHTSRIPNADLDAFAEAFPVSIAKVSREAVEGWIDRRKVGNRRFNNIRSHIIGLWKFARREGTIGVMLCGPELIAKRKVKYVVETYSPAEFDAYLSVVPFDWLPSIILGGLCGVRPWEMWIDPRNEEIKPTLEWRHFLWDRKKIDMPPEVAKDRRRRFIPICPAALSLLAPWRAAKGPVAPRFRAPGVPVDAYAFTRKWAEAAGVPWKNDGWRHSYASYRLAATQNAAALSEEMGNSVAMIRRHYLDLKHEDEAREWFARRKVPKSAKSIIALCA